MIKKIFIILLIFLTNIYAKNIILTEKTKNIEIDEIYFLEDQNFKLQEIKNKNFSIFTKDRNKMFRFEFKPTSTYWIKFDIKNQEDFSLKRNIYIDYPDIRYINFYEYDKNKDKFSSIKHNTTVKRVFNAELSLEANASRTIFIRLENHLAPTVFNLYILSPQELYLKENSIVIMHGIYVGMMILAIIYFILSFFIMKKFVFIMYMIHILCLILFQLFVQGYPKLFIDDLVLLDQLKIFVGFVSVASYTLFTIYFLKSSENKKYINTLYFGLLLLFTLLILYMYELISPEPFSLLVILIYLTIIFLSFKEHQKKNPYALNIFFSAIIIIIGIVLHASSIIFQVIELYSFLLYSLSYSNLLEVIIILFMFVTYVKKTQEDKEKMLYEKLQLEKNFSRKLTQEVRDKTKELEYINKNLDKKIKKEVAKNQEQERLIFFQSKLATMGETINIIAHQWRQPISIISNHLSNMQLKIEYKKQYKEEELLESIEKSQDGLKYISSTISLFQSYLKPKENSTNETFELCDTINRSIKLFDAILNKYQIEIIKEMPEYFKIKGNQEYFIQILMVLLNNSKDAIIIKQIKNPFIKFTIKENKDKIIFTFEDNAKGIHMKENIFDPYISGKNSTGLGLFITKNIVDKIFNGEISYENTKDGVKFSIHLPI